MKFAEKLYEVFPIMKCGDFMHAKQLKKDVEILSAKRLLYKVYFEEIGWEFEEGNPSNLRVETTVSGEKYLEDNYSKSAVWFGVYDYEELVGTIRATPSLNNKLELQLYTDLLPEWFQKVHSNIYELNRLAIRNEYRDSTASAHAFREIAEWAIKNHTKYLITTVNSPELETLAGLLNFKLTTKNHFKYSSKDTAFSKIMHIEITDNSVLEKVINICEQVIEE